jgi:hypothetical protein
MLLPLLVSSVLLMAHEYIDAVSATPVGPITVQLGDSVDISASFTLDGPTGGNASAYSLAWQKLSPGFPFSFATQDPAVAGTVYSKPYTPTQLGPNSVRVEASLLWSGVDEDEEPIGGLQQKQSNVITINVVHRLGEKELRALNAPASASTSNVATRAEVPGSSGVSTGIRGPVSARVANGPAVTVPME